MNQTHKIDKRVSKGDRTRAILIETTAQLLQEQGYAATGLNQIVRESKQPRGSLYFHFPGGKEELAAAAVASAADMVSAILATAFSDADTIGDVLRRTAALFIAELESSNFAKGCPVSTVALEANAATPLLQQTCARAYENWLTAIEAAFVSRGADPARAPRLARLTLASIEGALMLARSLKDVTPLTEISEDLEPLLCSAPVVPN